MGQRISQTARDYEEEKLAGFNRRAIDVASQSTEAMLKPGTE